MSQRKPSTKKFKLTESIFAFLTLKFIVSFSLCITPKEEFYFLLFLHRKQVNHSPFKSPSISLCSIRKVSFQLIDSFQCRVEQKYQNAWSFTSTICFSSTSCFQLQLLRLPAGCSQRTVPVLSSYSLSNAGSIMHEMSTADCDTQTVAHTCVNTYTHMYALSLRIIVLR